MAVVYFDSSAFVKLLVEEAGSDLAAEVWDGADVVVSSRLAYPEVRAALAAARRSRRIETVGQREAKRTWEQFWSAVRVVELTEAVAGSAGQLAEDLALGGADAVHLASALVLGDTHVVMAAWDERLRAGAERAGLSTVPSPP